MDTQRVSKQNVLMHPGISIAVIALFLWLGFNKVGAFLDDGHYRHLLFVMACIIIILNRILWLPQFAVMVERYSSVKNVRSFLPLIAISFIVASFVL